MSVRKCRVWSNAIMAISGLVSYTREVGDAGNAIKATSNSFLHTREVEDMGTASKRRQSTPAHFYMRGRWRRHKWHRNTIKVCLRLGRPCMHAGGVVEEARVLNGGVE